MNERLEPEPDNRADKPRATGPSPAPAEDDNARLVYHRVDLTQPENRFTLREVLTRELSPALMPLVVGFLLLLGLIVLLGYLTQSRMDEVNRSVLDLEQQHTTKANLLLNLRLAVTTLNNEARTRGEAESREGFKPPLPMRLNTARSELKLLLLQLDRPGVSGDPMWQSVRNELKSFLDLTDDLRRYSLEGFDKFKAADNKLNELQAQTTREQAKITQESESIQQSAVRSIRLWSVIALLVGALVAAGTMWEVQRRFGEMRLSMNEARRERVFTSQLLEGMVSAVAAIDENDRIRSANAAFFEIFPRASIGASLHEKIADEPAMRMLEVAASTRVDKSSYRGRWTNTNGDGTEKAFDVYSSPLAIDGARGQIVTLVDVTEAAEAERGLRRQESLAAVGQATAQVAHEIRNPLGSIRLGVAMLRDNVRDQEGLRTIELVERGIQHLNKLVVDVAQFSRRKALDRSRVDLHELINRSLELATGKITEKDTEVRKQLTEERLVGNWDPDQLRQVLVNVVANAVDASPKKAPVIIRTEVTTVATGDDLGPTRHARISISDQGEGIPKTTLDRIFEPFFSTKKRGTGLGLAIVKQIVEQHGGQIFVESEAEKGTTFVIDLPM